MELILKYFTDLSEEQIESFRQLEPLYKEWNEKINVISRKDIEFLYERHILHSLAISKVIQFKPGTQILDVGTGGGFPGIPLAILFPDTNFHLVDSIGKKIQVVQAVKNALKLENVRAEQNRAENVSEKYHFVVSRAVTRLASFYPWVKNKFLTDSFNDLNNGILYLKGGDISEELTELNKGYSIFHLHRFFSEDFFETKQLVHIPV